MTDVRPFDANPYAAPQVEPSQPGYSRPVLPLAYNPGLPLVAERVGWLPAYRRIRFRGELETSLVWNAMFPQEYVQVDGVTAASESNLSLGMKLIDYFDFPVHIGRLAWMSVEVRSTLGIWATAFRVRLDDRTLYQEGRWEETAKEPLTPKPR